MLFNSAVFLFAFLPVSIIGYFSLARFQSVFAAKAWLCVASLVFYGWWNPVFLILLACSIAFNYSLSLLLKSTPDAPDAGQTALLAAGVTANLAVLFFYKYLFPLLGLLHASGWIGTDFGSVVLVLGISFFTFTQIGYLVDCRQGLVRDRSFINYVLFVTFFPHLIAGPILHHREIMPQFADEATYRFRADNLMVGITVFAAGLVKKVLLADHIAPWAELGFAHTAGMPFLQAWSTALAYSMQLYFDFSGYCDMAIGLGIMFGVRLPLNFNSPYKATSVIEFWQRWHMTLTRYLTLLLYNPIALAVARRRQRRGLPAGRQAARTPSGFVSMIVVPTLTTMILAGIWHGAGLQFIVYGVLFGVYLCVNHAWRIFAGASREPRAFPGRLWAALWPVALTYLCVLVSQIFFRAVDTRSGVALIAGMLGAHGSGLPLPIPPDNVRYLGMAQHWLLDHGVFAVALRDAYNAETLPLVTNTAVALGLAVIAFAAPNIYQIMGHASPALTKVRPASWPRRWHWKASVPWALGTGLMLFCSCLYFDHPSRFLYFQF